MEIEPIFNEDRSGLDPVLLRLSPAGKAAWIKIHDDIEERLAADGEYCDIKDVASKAADNVARLAALFHVFEHGPDGEISADHINSAARIVKWHLNEALRFFLGLAVSPEGQDAAKLEKWLLKTVTAGGSNKTSRRDAQRTCFGSTGKGGNRLDIALKALSSLGRARLVGKEIEIRPELLNGVAECPF